MGGRMALAADVKVGGRYLHLYSVHFESGRTNDRFRDDQALELAEDAREKPHGVIIGGDMNTSEYLDDLRNGTERDGATRALRRAGYADAHAGLPPEARITTPSGVAIDLLFGKGVAFTGAGIGTPEQWGGLSDHYPVWARVRLEQPSEDNGQDDTRSRLLARIRRIRHLRRLRLLERAGLGGGPVPGRPLVG
jgi:endonuclease/exonuclease/phosphatase family metal-dependent hydrolase